MMNVKRVFLFFLSVLVFEFSQACSTQEREWGIACDELSQKDQKNIVINDELMLSLIEGPLSWENVRPILGNVKRKEIAGQHAHKGSNYLVESEEGESYYSYYLSKSNSFPLCVKVKSSSLLERISSHAEHFDTFKKGFNTEDSIILTVGSLEGRNILKLVFLEGKLNLVIYRTDYLD